jgi:8-oxo-dGTP pyrophosphatase MutT (NUDIX family)
MALKDEVDRLRELLLDEGDEKPAKQQPLWFGVKYKPSKPTDMPTSDKPPKGSYSKGPYGPSGVGPEGTAGAGEDPVKAYKKPEKWISAGGVVLGGIDDLDHVYIRKPSNNYGPWAFAKGRIDDGETKEQAALREVEEEIGIVAKIIPGGYLGLAEGSMSHTHYFLMFAQRNLRRYDKETEKVMLASWTEAIHKFAKGGNNRDIKILTKAMDLVEKIKRKRASTGKEDAWL